MTIEPSPAAKELSDTINRNRENIVGGYDNGRNQRELIQEHLDAYAEAHKSVNKALVEENARLRAALEKIAKDAPEKEPNDYGYTGNSDDSRNYGYDMQHYLDAKIAREALSPQPTDKEK